MSELSITLNFESKLESTVRVWKQLQSPFFWGGAGAEQAYTYIYATAWPRQNSAGADQAYTYVDATDKPRRNGAGADQA